MNIEQGMTIVELIEPKNTEQGMLIVEVILF
jgi:hypothetical protein